jgi:type II secretory ATPase GspE/PulE/Tfp pilus assembly ATPase PilB-like protein
MTGLDASPTLAPGVSREYLLHHRVCPRRLEATGPLVIGIGVNHRPVALDELAIAYGREIVTESLTDAQLEGLIERVTSRTERRIELSRLDQELDSDPLAADVRDLVNQPPVVRYVNLLVRDAYDAAASDIHLEATRHDLIVRFRLDGVLVPAPEPPPQLQHAVVSRLKLLADLDISERRRPQDGRIRVRLEDRELDLRVATIPTVHGESVVLRLLDRGGRPVGLDELGLSRELERGVEQLVARPHGMLLVTGPTGSGKTTTLYAALQRRDGSREKIITVEDPVEYQLNGVTQVPVQRAAGVTFASALRAILRQDPDVVMIGEMRDAETAEIAVQASMTGHLVLSTLHTNDALRALPRLLDLGIAEHLVASTLEGILAQRLVRRICDACRERYRPDRTHVVAIAGAGAESEDYEHGAGCAECRGTGFRGRLGIFELLTVSDDLRHAIATGAPLTEVRVLARETGFSPLRNDGWNKVLAGLTTVEEVHRVVQE